MHKSTMRYGLLLFSLSVAVAVEEQITLISRYSSIKADTQLGIYHGKKTTIRKHPYLVGIIAYGEFVCAGTIVSESWIITLGECGYGYAPSELTVVAGSSNLTDGTIYNVKQIVVHPNYGHRPLDYEFACIQIESKFKWSSVTKAIKITTKSPKLNSVMTVAGYGSTDSVDESSTLCEDDVSSSTLLAGTMRWIDLEECKTDYAALNISWSDRMGCAYNKGKTTLCTGDSADAFVRKNVMYGMFIAGASSGFCSKYAKPVILADVSSVAQWIKTTTGAKLYDQTDEVMSIL